MPIGLTARQRADLAAMLPNVEESVAGLKRLIADAKDRTRALQKLKDAEDAQKRHATEVGVPFNADGFARRRAELDALPKTLTVEDGQLASFTALQRAIAVVLEGPYVREGRRPAPARNGKASAGRSARKPASKSKKAGAGKASPRKTAKAGRGAASRLAGKSTPKPTPKPVSKPVPKPVKVVKPLPLSLGS